MKINLILEENIMGKSYKPITSMKEVPEQLRKLRRQYPALSTGRDYL